MRVNRSVLAVGVVIAMALLAAGVAVAVTPADATDADGNRTIQVSASADLSAQSNQAVVTFGVVRRADNATVARQQVARNVSQVRSALQNADISDNQIRTVTYQIGESRDDYLEDYRAGHLLRVNVSDVETAGTVIDAAVASGANEIDGVEFGLDDGTREQLRERALEQAVANAREKAKTIAGQANLTVTGVKRVTTSDVGYRPHRRYAFAETASAGDGGAPTSIEGGPVAVSAQVQVVFEAAE